MRNRQLPSKLGKEPLIDAVFEIRFDAVISAAEIMPGHLHVKLGGDVKIERLPVSQLPPEVRQQDPNLANQPLVRINWENQLFMVGDRSLAVACLFPYPGWTKFREVILKVVGYLAESGIVRSVERYSIKYVDMLLLQPNDRVGDWVNLNVSVGDAVLTAQPFQLHMEIASGNYIHGLLLGSPAQARGLDGVTKQGMIISVDTVSNREIPDLTELVTQLPNRIDEIHTCNKQMFFDCLTDAGIEKLEPEYD
jgi:uncharacterized protein (TIGR04255 family)